MADTSPYLLGTNVPNRSNTNGFSLERRKESFMNVLQAEHVVDIHSPTLSVDIVSSVEHWDGRVFVSQVISLSLSSLKSLCRNAP